MPTYTKPGSATIYHEAVLLTNTSDSFIKWPCEMMGQTKNIYLHYDTTIVSMTVKLGRLVTYLDGLLSTKSYNTLVSLQDQ